MKLSEALQNVHFLFVDTAPLIYFVENHPTYGEPITRFLQAAEKADVRLVTATVSITEVLTKPLKEKNAVLEQSFHAFLFTSGQINLIPISAAIATEAARIRAQYGLKTPDALQVAAAIHSGCDAFLTNDLGLKRLTELRILIIDELEFDSSPETSE